MKRSKRHSLASRGGYDDILAGVIDLLESARRTSARAVNTIMTAVYWEIGRRIVEFEQAGEKQAEYGSVLIQRMALDLSRRFGRGFGKSNLYQMRGFYLAYADIFQTPSGILAADEDRQTAPKKRPRIGQTPSDLSGKSEGGGIARTPSAQSPSPEISQTPSGKFELADLARRFPLPWSHYVRLLKVEKPEARRFYETEALRGGVEDFRYLEKKEGIAMQTATIDEVRAHLPELLQQVNAGEEIVIVSEGKPVARLVAAPPPKGVPVPGRGKGKLVIHADDDEHLKDFAEYMP